MKILTKWLRAYLPGLTVDDAQLAEDLTLRGIAVDGIYPLGEGNGSFFEMDITTNRVDAMNHYGVAREAAAIYGPVSYTHLDVYKRQTMARKPPSANWRRFRRPRRN